MNSQVNTAQYQDQETAFLKPSICNRTLMDFILASHAHKTADDQQSPASHNSYENVAGDAFHSAMTRRSG